MPRDQIPADPRLPLRRAIWDFQHSSRIGWLDTFEAADADPLIHAILDAFAMGELLDQKRRREYSEQRKRAQQQRKPKPAPRFIDQKSRAAGEREEREQELWDADANCAHVVKSAPGGGIRCIKCRGWFCY